MEFYLINGVSLLNNVSVFMKLNLDVPNLFAQPLPAQFSRLVTNAFVSVIIVIRDFEIHVIEQSTVRKGV